MIIGAVRIFKWHHQNCLIFAKISACDSTGSSNFQMTSLNLGYFCENVNSWLQGQLKFSSDCIWIALFSWTLLIVVIGPVRLVIIGGGQAFKWHHRVMYCVILSVIIDATPFVLKMHSYLWIFYLKVRHVLSGVSGIVFAYNVTDEIVPGVFLSRLICINRG